MNAKQRNRFIPYSMFFVVFVFHLYLMAPGLYWGESSIVTTRGWFLGGSHPPGYSNFIQLLHVFQRIIPLGDIPFRSNLAGIIILAGTIALLYHIFRLFESSELIAIPASIGFSIALPVIYAVRAAEVYSLNLFLSLASICLLIQCEKCLKLIFLLALVCGLGVVHHPTFIFLIPGILFCIVYEESMRIYLVRNIPFLICFFLIGTSSILFFPLRETASPLMTWGNPDNVNGLVRMISASEESSGSFLSGISDPSAILARFFKVVKMVLAVLTFPGLLLCLPGFGFLWNKKRGLFYGLIGILFLMTLAVSLYESNESESFYLIGLVIFWMLSTMGIVAFTAWFKEKDWRCWSVATSLLPLVILLLSLKPAIVQSASSSESIKGIVSQRFLGLPSQSIIISRKSDYCFQNWYLSHVERYASVRTIFQHLLSFKWYYRDLTSIGLLDKTLNTHSFEDSRSWNSIVTAVLVRQNQQQVVIVSDLEVLDDLRFVKESINIFGCSPTGAVITRLLPSDLDEPIHLHEFAFDQLSMQLIMGEYLGQSRVYELCNDSKRANEASTMAEQFYQRLGERLD